MTIEIYLLLFLGQTILSAVVAILSLIKFQSRSLTVRLIGFIFLASCVANIASWFFVKSSVTRDFVNTTYPVYLMISLALYSRIYFEILHKKNARLFVMTTAVFSIFALINLFFIQKTTANSYSYLFHSAIILIYCLLYFYILIQDLPSLYVHHLP